MSRVYIAFGANLGEPLAAFERALGELAALPGTRVAAHSSCYRTAPVGVVGEQPDYINAVIELETALAPHPLLEALFAIEHAGGRTRTGHRAPRTMDLDLLLHGDAVIDEPDLTLPHPRLHERAFVLHPLAEIAPQLVIPGRGPVAALLSSVAGQSILRL